MGALIKLEHLSKTINNNHVLKDISFEVKNGEVFGIIGRNGAGKTTLLRVLIGFYHYNSGHYSIYNDNQIPKNKEFLKSNFGFATQENCFYRDLTVFENIFYFGKLYYLKKDLLMHKIIEVLKLVELENKKNSLAKNLSGGMKRRLDLACALIHSPHVLILDEPTAELDPISSKHMWKTLKRINSTGTTIILSSHFLNKVEHICDRIAIIENGSIIATGTPKAMKELYSKNEEIIIETFPGDYNKVINTLQRSNMRSANIYKREKSLVVYTPTADSTLLLILRILGMLGEKLVELEVNKPTLNEIFETMIGKSKTKIKSSDKLEKDIEKSVDKFKQSELRDKLLKQYPKELVDKVLQKK